MNYNIPCITCQVNLRDTLRPLPKRGFYYCTHCEACYEYVVIQDIFGTPSEWLNPVKPGRPEYSSGCDEIQYNQEYSNSTEPPKYYSVPPPQIPHTHLPDFEEERDIIKKSNTVKEFLKNSKYLEKPYDKD